ncbi:hypothetical protein F5148DRAFT_1285438 [Russula earlei]|uniref:Uncharacterized protein n=1 Tax=Russula earlei TaxID=71964 RepID=A0ACC0U6E7_9AGAM|nr:hypothetical protein F5148DRAFT_1285438 [Russula earlei]
MGGAVVSRIPINTVRIQNLPSNTNRSSLLESLGCPQDTVLSLEVSPNDFTKMTATVTVKDTREVERLLKLDNTSLGGSSRAASRVSVDTQFHGFTVVAGGTNSELDIISIHGLNGHAFNSWATRDLMWLRDLLPERVPNARVLLYGYNANVLEDCFYGPDQRACQTLPSVPESLGGNRKGDCSFVNSSCFFGGLVLKQALIFIKDQSEFSALQDVALGVVFLATPHRGSKHADDMSGILVNMAKISFDARAKRLLRTIQKDSNELMDMALSFRDLHTELQFASFCEQLPMKVSGMDLGLLVDQWSATLEVAHAPVIPVNRDHVTIAKIDGPGDGVLNLLVSELTRMITHAEEHGILEPQVNLQ